MKIPALLKPDTAKNSACHKASPGSYIKINLAKKAINPTICIETAVITIATLKRCMPPNCSLLKVSRINRLCAIETLCPSTVRRNAARDINPSPPTNISIAMINCPANVQFVEVSTTTSPVTVTADVAVNRAFKNPPKEPS